VFSVLIYETIIVSNLSNLETIDASGCNLSEITLDGAVKLSSLNINCNEITDLHIPETNEIKKSATSREFEMLYMRGDLVVVVSPLVRT